MHLPRSIPLRTPPRLGEPLRSTKREKQFAAGLMHQQCWCWGQDVSSAGNLLMDYGFERRRRPGVDAGGAGGTRYQIDEEGTRFALWGFGMWLALPGGEQGFFARYERGVWLLPRSFDVEDVHSAREVEPHMRRPINHGEKARAQTIAMAAASWCEAYERWILETQGPDHRRETLEMSKHCVVAHDRMVPAWQRAREIYRRWYAVQSQAETAWMPPPKVSGTFIGVSAPR